MLVSSGIISCIRYNILGVKQFIYFYRGGNINFNVSLWYDIDFVFIILKYCWKPPPTNPFMFSICFELFFNNSGQDLISTAIFNVFYCSPVTCMWLRNPSGKFSFYSFCNISSQCLTCSIFIFFFSMGPEIKFEDEKWMLYFRNR